MDKNDKTSVTEVLESSGYTAEWQKLSKGSNLKSTKRRLKRSVKIFIALVLILISLFAGGFCYYKFFKKDAEDVYRSLLQNAYVSADKAINEEIKETSNNKSLDGSISINSNIKDLKKLDNAALDFIIETNEKEKTIASNFSYKEDDKEILNGKVYFKDNKLYIDSKQIYKKPLIINDMPINYDFSNVKSKKKLEDARYLLNKTNRYINKSLSASLFKTEYGRADLEGKKALVQKNIMYISKNDVNKIKNIFLNEVIKDEKYISILSNLTSTSVKDVKASLDKCIKEDISKEAEDIKVEIDTNLITDRFIKLNILSGKESIVEITKQKKDTYLFKVYEEGKLYTEGTLKAKDSDNLDLEVKYEEYTYDVKIIDDSKLSVEVKNKNDEFVGVTMKLDETSKKVKKVSTKKAVDINKLTQSEYGTIENNISKLQKSSKVLSELPLTE